MSDILLKELSNADIDWLVTHGQRQPLAAADGLIQPGQPAAALYLLLEGCLAVRSAGDDQEIAQLFRGELVGEGWLFDLEPAVSIVSASDATLVLAVSKSALVQKLQQDVSFAAHFYRALVLIMSERIRRLFEQTEPLRYQSEQMVKEALLVFGELHDSDIDWMVGTGQVEKLGAGRVLMHAGRPVDALYTVLDGQLAIATTDRPCDPLSLCFHGLEQQGATQNFRPVAYISRGGLPGIISFLDFQPLPVRIHAVRESLLLAIPRQQVTIKLQEDLGFAARFYRVIATQMANLLRTVVADTNAAETPADAADELDLAALQQVSKGGFKFDWMLKHLGVACS
ncbi:MAG: cyclic nucleotide-binding domain-containing protein [Leptolyngbya sp. SIO4C1]|nr:cyclic nucleotide-binding domain-containing protein [Leptolyngbya sp. SIO4C1]